MHPRGSVLSEVHIRSCEEIMRETYYDLEANIAKHCRIALISDLHDRDGSAIIASIQQHKPDIIAIAGDLTNNLPDLPDSFEPFIASCAAIAPTFYSLGNHEFSFTESEENIARESGAILLKDEYISCDGLCIGGLSSRTSPGIYSHRRKTVPPRTDWLNDFEARSGYKILLSHHPEYYEPYLKARKIDLILSGHAHGGQIRLFGRGLFAPGQGILPKYTKGLHDGRFIISAGLANTARLIPRFNNPTELVYVDIKVAAD